MSSKDVFNKENLEGYLIDLSREFKILNGNKMPAEIILVGGASILLNYNFRKSTDDVDAIIRAASVIKEAINIVAEKRNLPNNWLNMDFINSESYSDKLLNITKHYKTFLGVLDVNIIDDEYLIAMKLRAGRRYKKDLSDVVGIIYENRKKGNEITREKLEKAFLYLYDDLSKMPEISQRLFEEIFTVNNLQALYDKKREKEQKIDQTLDDFKQMFPDEINKIGLNNIINSLDNMIEKEEEQKRLTNNTLKDERGKKDEDTENSGSGGGRK
jgi:hypothetical protein